MIEFAWRVVGILGLRGFIIIGSVVAGIAAVWWIYDAGGDQREAEIAEDNRRAEDAADDAGTRVDRCFARGGEWNSITGRCDLVPVVPRRPDSP